MKYNYSKNYSKQLIDALNWLKDNGLGDLASYCETSPELGDVIEVREARIWIGTLVLFIERFKAESLNNNDVEEIEEILDDFNMMFWTIPSKYREDILSKLNEYALIKGVEIGLDVFNHPEPKMVFTLLSE